MYIIIIQPNIIYHEKAMYEVPILSYFSNTDIKFLEYLEFNRS